MIKQAQDKIKIDGIEWITRNVMEPEARKIAISYKIQFVPTTIINGETKLVGVTTVERLEEEILKFK